MLIPSISFGQQYSIDWYKIAGGGGTSTGGVYFVSGTIGQHDASGVMTGGSYSLTGGFWALISVVQTPGLPLLTITLNSQLSTVTVSWPDTGSYTLQQNSNLAVPGGWTTSGYPITTFNGISSITITPPTGNLFFRLKQRGGGDASSPQGGCAALGARFHQIKMFVLAILATGASPPPSSDAGVASTTNLFFRLKQP